MNNNENPINNEQLEYKIEETKENIICIEKINNSIKDNNYDFNENDNKSFDSNDMNVKLYNNIDCRRAWIRK